LFAESTARAGAEQRVADLVAGLTAQVRAEPGNLAFEPYTLKADPRRWFVYEAYVDEAAFQAHITAPYGAEFNAALAPHIEEDGSQLTWLVSAG
jgi:quinol monooxygenase YgiN